MSNDTSSTKNGKSILASILLEEVGDVKSFVNEELTKQHKEQPKEEKPQEQPAKARLPGTIEDLEKEAEDGNQFDGSNVVVIGGKAHETHVYRKKHGESLILDYNYKDSILSVVGSLAKFTNMAMNPPQGIQPTGDDMLDERIQKVVNKKIPKSPNYPIKNGDIVSIMITGCVYIAPDIKKKTGKIGPDGKEKIEITPGEKTPIVLAEEYNEIKVPFYKIMEADPKFSKKQLEKDPEFYDKNPEYLPQLSAEPWQYVDINTLPDTLGELVGVKTHDPEGNEFKLHYLEVKDDDGTRYFPLSEGSKLRVYIQISQHIDGDDEKAQAVAKQKDVYRNTDGNKQLGTESDEMWDDLIGELAHEITIKKGTNGNNGTNGTAK